MSVGSDLAREPNAGFAVSDLVRPDRDEPGPHLDWLTTRQPLDGAACDAIVAICRHFPVESPDIVGNARYPGRREGEMRKIGLTPRSLPLLELLAEIAGRANAQAFELDLTTINREPQYVEYVAGRGRFDWHNDYSHAVAEAPRKLTVIIQLSDPDEYEGGRLEVFSHEVQTLPEARGSVIAFPSLLYHRVTPVTQGCRRALVCWIAGPRLR